MPTGQEILGIVVAILVIWFLLKMAKLAFRLIVLFAGLLVVIWMLYHYFVR
jgi:hypothetical protein